MAFRQDPALPHWREGDEGPSVIVFFRISTFLFPKTNINGILLDRPLLNGKRVTAMQPENFRLADRAESESNRCRAFAPPRSLEALASHAGAGRRVDGEDEGKLFRPATH
jgi:hypothetical protein